MLNNIIFSILLLSNQELTVEITGNVFFSSKYLLGDIASISDQKAAERLIADILDEYNNAGFPFCTILPEFQYDDDRPARLLLTIEEGQRVIIEELLLRSDGNTDVNAARRIASFKRGEHFSSKTLAFAKKRLMSTNAFERIGERVVDRDGKYYLLFSLIEKESDILSVFGSLSGTEIEFGASFSSFNLLGTLRQLNFNYEYQRLFSLQFREPVLIAPAMLDADFAIWTYDTARLIEGHIRFFAPVGELFNITLLSGIEYVNYYENDTVTYQSSDNLLGIGMGFDYQSTNWSNLQTLHLDYLFRDDDRLRVEYDGELMIYKFLASLHYHRVQTDSLEFFDYIRVGGVKNLRGYLEDEFLVARALWLNLEYHRLPVFPLIDIARLDGELFYAYGLGLDARSNYADASIVIAWPRGGTWRDGKLHLTFARGF